MLSIEEKEKLKEELFVVTSSMPYFAELARFLEWYAVSVSSINRRTNDYDADIKNQMLKIKSNKELYDSVKNVALSFVGYSASGTRRIPCGFAFVVWKILEKCKDKNDIHWAKELLKTNGELYCFLKECNIDLPFTLPSINNFDDTTSWARTLKSDMFRNFVSLAPEHKIPKKLSESQKKIREKFKYEIDDWLLFYFSIPIDVVETIFGVNTLPPIELVRELAIKIKIPKEFRELKKLPKESISI